MYVSAQITQFLQFVIIGIIIALIFDFFRAYRRLHRVSNRVVMIQDIIYFFIATVVIVFGIIHILDSAIRFYTFLAIMIGCGIYVSLFSKYIMKIYETFFKILQTCFDIFTTPIALILQIIQKIYIKMKKMIKKCCKMFTNMVSLKKKKIKKKTNKTKEGSEYEKSA